MVNVSSYTPYAKTIVDHIAPKLKAAGFRKRRHRFNRALDDGLIHEFSLYLLSADSSGHGTGYFHAGCYVPAAELYERNGTDPKWVTSARCCIRDMFNNDPKAAWPGNFYVTAMAKDPSKADVHVERALKFLDGISTLEQIMAIDPTAHKQGIGTPLGIVQSCIAFDQGERGQAKELLSQYLAAARTRGSDSHTEFIEDWAKEQGLL